jgi:hypothetical protein
VPDLDKLKRKAVLIIKAKIDKGAPDINSSNVSKEVVLMEVNRQILENLYLLCQVTYFYFIATILLTLNFL